MLFEVCKELNNFFDYERLFDTFTISDGSLSGVSLKAGQYFRIIGSVFNDGVFRYPAVLTDETFTGSVWKMAVPQSFISLCDDISAWVEKYGTASSEAMSPFTSESFGGYSYTKSRGTSSGSTNGSAGASWQDAFTSRLNIWRKPRCRY